MQSLPLIIEANELQEHLGKPSLLIIDLSQEAHYREAHIPGAIFLPFQALMAGTPPAPGKLPSVEQLSHVFTQLGLTSDTHVVAYDDEGGGWAGRLIWTLDVIGHTRYSYLNGGRHAWLASGLDTSAELTRATPLKTPYAISLHREYLAEVDDIIASLTDDSIQVWDARSLAEHDGRKVLAAKAGHIPGAIHCEWTELMDNNNSLRIRSDAQDYLNKKGIKGDKTIITHCQSHHRSAFAYLVGKSLGYTIKGYAGSWSEWGNHPTTPVEV